MKTENNIMSSIYVTKSGFLRIDFLHRGKRRVLSLGRDTTLLEGREIQRLLDIVLKLKPGEKPDTRTRRELLAMPDKVKHAFRKQGLFDFCSTTVTLGELYEKVRNRPDTAKKTATNYRIAWERLLEYFGSEKRVSALDPEEIEEFSRHLLTDRGLCGGTVYGYFLLLRCDFRGFQESGRWSRILLQNCTETATTCGKAITCRNRRLKRSSQPVAIRKSDLRS